MIADDDRPSNVAGSSVDVSTFIRSPISRVQQDY